MNVILTCKLKELREKAGGLSQRDLEELTGVDHSEISRYEKNQKDMALKTAAKFAVVLKCGLDDLYDYREDSTGV